MRLLWLVPVSLLTSVLGCGGGEGRWSEVVRLLPTYDFSFFATYVETTWDGRQKLMETTWELDFDGPNDWKSEVLSTTVYADDPALLVPKPGVARSARDGIYQEFEPDFVDLEGMLGVEGAAAFRTALGDDWPDYLARLVESGTLRPNGMVTFRDEIPRGGVQSPGVLFDGERLSAIRSLSEDSAASDDIFIEADEDVVTLRLPDGKLRFELDGRPMSFEGADGSGRRTILEVTLFAFV